MSRPRAGEWTAAAGGAGLLVTLFLPWFVPLDVVFVPTGQISGNAESGWSSLGWVTLAFCLAAIAVAAWLVVANATNRPVAEAVAASVLAATVGTVAFVALTVRVLLVQPGPNALTTIRYGAYLGLLASLVLAVGGWLAIKDDRTDAPESAYTPPEPRPPPPARAA